MSVNVTGAYIYFSIHLWDGFAINITQTTLSLAVVTAILITAMILLGKGLTKRPSGKQVLVEKGVMMMRNMVVETMGEHNARWTPYIMTIFLSSICGSFIGLTGFLRSTTADLSVPLTWAIMTTAIIWYHSIKTNGLGGWLKGFTEPIVVMTPMNIISEIAQPVSMAFRHFGNVAGGGVITSILYTALGMASSLLITLLAKTVVIPLAVLALGVFMSLKGRKQKKGAKWIFGIVFGVLGLLGILQYAGILSNVPILQFGIPAVLSCYFDLFSGFVQAYVFSLLSMVYIGNACPPPAEAAA